MRRHGIGITALAVMLCSAADAWGAGASARLPPAEATFARFCTACHLGDRPLLANKNRADWEFTVKKMSDLRRALYGKDGDAIPEEAQKVIVDYLLKKSFADLD